MLQRKHFTRERIDRIIDEARRHGEFEALTHEERDQSRRQFLQDLNPDKDLWVLGYGSLIWNPAFNYVESRPARIYGFHRSFCLHLTIGRGSPKKPGLMLALDYGGSCYGMAFRIAAREVETETEILWLREAITGAYQPRWLNIRTDKELVRGMTFVINRSHSRYAGRLSLTTTVNRLLNGEGQLGTCREYLENTVSHLEEMKVRDNYLHRLCQLLPPQDSKARN